MLADFGDVAVVEDNRKRLCNYYPLRLVGMVMRINVSSVWENRASIVSWNSPAAADYIEVHRELRHRAVNIPMTVLTR